MVAAGPATIPQATSPQVWATVMILLTTALPVILTVVKNPVLTVQGLSAITSRVVLISQLAALQPVTSTHVLTATKTSQQCSFTTTTQMREPSQATASMLQAAQAVSTTTVKTGQTSVFQQATPVTVPTATTTLVVNSQVSSLTLPTPVSITTAGTQVPPAVMSATTVLVTNSTMPLFKNPPLQSRVRHTVLPVTVTTELALQITPVP